MRATFLASPWTKASAIAVSIAVVASCAIDKSTAPSLQKKAAARLDCQAQQVRAANVGVASVDAPVLNAECQELPGTGVSASRVEWLDTVGNRLCEKVGWCQSRSAWGYSEAGGGGGGGPSSDGSDTYTAEQAATFWNAAAHDSLMRNGLRDTPCFTWIGRMSGTSIVEDVLHSGDNARHYLRDSLGQTPEFAIARSEAWVTAQIDSGHAEMETHGATNDAKDHLARALHTIYDGLSPEHVYPNGDPKVYSGIFFGNHSPAWWGGETTKEIDPLTLQTGRSKSIAACTAVRGSGS